MSQLHHGIHEEAGKYASRQDLIERIKAILANCGGLRPPASLGAINRYILLQAEQGCERLAAFKCVTFKMNGI